MITRLNNRNSNIINTIKKMATVRVIVSRSVYTNSGNDNGNDNGNDDDDNISINLSSYNNSNENGGDNENDDADETGTDYDTNNSSCFRNCNNENGKKGSAQERQKKRCCTNNQRNQTKFIWLGRPCVGCFPYFEACRLDGCGKTVASPERCC